MVEPLEPEHEQVCSPVDLEMESDDAVEAELPCLGHDKVELQ